MDLEDTQTCIADALLLAQRPVLWASGGADSTVLLHLCRPWAHQLTVVHATKDGDDGFPGVTETCLEHCARWGYAPPTIVAPWLTYDTYVSQYGYPMEVVPTALEGATALIQSPYRTSTLKIASWVHCTFARTIWPLMLASATLQSDLVLTGSKLSDAPWNHAFAREISAGTPQGWRRVNPLADWSHAAVFAYIDQHALALPPLYQQWKRVWKEHGKEAPDCLRCPWIPDYWPQVARRFYPEVYETAWPVVQSVYQEVQQVLDEQRAALRQAQEQADTCAPA